MSNMSIGPGSATNASSILEQQANASSALVSSSMSNLMSTIANAPPGLSSAPMIAPVSSDPFYSSTGYDSSLTDGGFSSLGLTDPSFNAGYSGTYGGFYGSDPYSMMDPYSSMGSGMCSMGMCSMGCPMMQMQQLDQCAEYMPSCGCSCSCA